MTDEERTGPLEEGGPEEETRRLPSYEDVTRPIGDDSATQAHTHRHHQHPPARADRTEFLPVAAAAGGLAGGLIALVLIVALLVGIAIGYTQARPGERDVVARELVAAAGGQIVFDGAGRLDIPQGALPTATTITIRRQPLDRTIRVGSPGDPDGVTYRAGEVQMYAFEPADLRFQQPVTIAIPRMIAGSALLVDTPAGARVIPAEARGNVVVVTTTSFFFLD